MTPLYVKARAEARLETALREYREARREWYRYGTRQAMTSTSPWVEPRRLYVEAFRARVRWCVIHDLLHTPEPTWAQLRGEGYDELELRAIGGDR